MDNMAVEVDAEGCEAASIESIDADEDGETEEEKGEAAEVEENGDGDVTAEARREV